MGNSIKEKIANKLFGNEIKKLAGTIVKAQSRAISFSGTSVSRPSMSFAWTGALSGFPVYSRANTLSNINDGYVGSDDVYSIVRRIARTSAMIPLKVYRIKDEKALKEYEYASKQQNPNTQSLLRKQFLKIKALEEVKDDNDLQMLIDNPNPVYSKTEFYEGVYSFRLLTGNTYLHTPLLDLGVNAGRPLEMWLLPSQWMSLQVSDTWPRQILGYRLQIANLIPIGTEEVVHIRYFNPQFSYVGNELIGLSPLTAGSKVLDRQEAETDYSVNAFQNSGISGIVSNENMNSDEIEKGALGQMKTEFFQEATGVENARKLMFSVGKINYTAIGLSPVDMDILKSEIRTFKKLCNLYGVSDMLFNNDGIGNGVGGKTDIVYKDLYTNAALPEVYALRDALNQKVTPKFNKKGERYFIDADITGITELQDDMKDMAAVFSTSPVMIPSVICKAFGWPIPEGDPNIDKIYIKNGYSELDAIQAIENLPINTPNGN